MRFKYLAASPSGSLQQGEMEALSVQEVAEKLREKALVPIEIKEARRPWLRLKWQRNRVEDLLLFTEQLHRLLKAGVPLDRALKILAKIFATAGKQDLEHLTNNIKQELEHGKKLSEALANEELFPEFYVSLVRAGEASGALENVLKDLAQYLRDKQQFQQDLLSALLYPSFLLVFGLLAVQTVLVYVLPRFSVIFEEMGVKPPAFTRFLIAFGLFWREWGWVFLVLLAAGFFYVRYVLLAPERRPQLERRLLGLPFVGRMWLLAELARVFRGLSVMLQGGVAIEQALKLAASIPGLVLLRDFFAHLAEEIKQGRALSQLLQDLPLKADFVFDLVAIGEETGDLAASFGEIASLCEEEVRLGTKRFLTILEPATILFFGLLLGTIIVSILVAIFDLRLS